MLARAAGWLYGQPYLLLVLTTFFWGGNFAAGRAAAGHVPPVTLALIRWTLAFLILLPFAWPHLRRDWPTIRRNLPFLTLLAATGIAAFNTLLYVGLEHTTAIKAALLQSSQPLLIGIWSFVLFSQMLTGKQVVGIVISSLGVIGIITEWSPEVLLGLELNIGDLVVFAACVCYALYSVLLRRLPQMHWTSLLSSTFLIGVVILVPFWAWEMAAGRFPELNASTLGIAAYVAIFPSIGSYLFYMRGVQLVGPNRAGPFLHLVPVFATMFAIVLLGEQLRLYHLASFALIFLGITIATRRGRVAPGAEAAPGRG